MTNPDSPIPGSPDVAALQSQVQLLQAQNAELTSRLQPGNAVSRGIRSAVVVVLLILATVLALLAPPAIWGRNIVLNTDRYVETVAPLARDAGVKSAVVAAIDAEFAKNVDVAALARQVLPPRADILAAPLAAAANNLVDKAATEFVNSQAFLTLWDTLNRTAHTQIAANLTGQNAGTALQVRNGTVYLDLAPVVAAVKTQLVDSGFALAANVPTVNTQIEVAQISQAHNFRGYTKALNAAANWLPWIALVLYLGAIALSRHRRRTVIASALCVAGAMLVLALALIISRGVYLNSLPGVYLDQTTAGNMFDTLVRFLRAGLRTVLVVTLVIAFIAWVSGPSHAARGIRRVVVSVPRRATGRWAGGPVGRFVSTYRTALIAGVLGIAALVLVLWSNPSLAVILTIGIIAVVLLLVIAWLRAPAGAPVVDLTDAPETTELPTSVGPPPV